MRDTIDISFGNGGYEMHQLINEVIKPPIDNNYLAFPTDSASVGFNGNNLLFTTDSHIIDPIIFPGGDIGKLSVCGTANDILVSGGKPLFMSLSLIIEEGFETAVLKMLMNSIKAECENIGIKIVTGDTKVLEKGKGDKIFINTSCIGIPIFKPLCHFSNIRNGDDIIITRGIAEHGIAVLIQREGISLDTPIISDVCSLHPIIYALSENGISPKFMTDPTRGGLSAALNEIASSSKMGIRVNETAIPVGPSVMAVCDILGLNQFEIACEGTAVIITESKDTDRALEIIRGTEIGQKASVIGKITDSMKPVVVLHTSVGTDILMNMPEGLNLPRIC